MHPIKDERMNLLFTSAGRRVVLINLFRQALEQAGETGAIVAVDARYTAPALQAADFAYTVPWIRQEGVYVPSLLEICRKHKIDVVIPCVDPDLLVLAQARPQFEQLGSRLLLSRPEVVHICHNKLETYHFFRRHEVPTVKTMRADDFIVYEELPFPLFVKPVDGSASIDSYIIKNRQELEMYLSRVPNGIVQELATGTEDTIGVLADLDGTVLSVVPRQRLEVRCGEVSKSATRKDWGLIEHAQRIVQALGAIGPLCIQCFQDSDHVHFTEINSRFGGGLPLSVAAGANQPLWVIQMFQGKKLSPMIGQFTENLVMLRYDDAYFVNERNLKEMPCYRR